MKLKISKIVNNFFSKSTWFIILMALSTLALAGSAAYYSVFGLSSLFAGARTEVIIMASALEFSKLILASYLHNHWKSAGWLKWYLTIALLTLMLITSAGIYGFLTSAYQKTADQLGVMDKQVEVVELKKNRFEESLTGYQVEREQLNTSISELTKGLSNNVITYTDANGNQVTTTSSATRRALTNELEDMKSQRTTVSIKMESLTDSITKLDLQILDLETNNEVAAEVGPLRYMAEITGNTMATIVNWFTLLIVFVFDPLAISMVIALNKLTNKKGSDDSDKDSDGSMFDTHSGVSVSKDSNENGEEIPTTGIDLVEEGTEVEKEEDEEITFSKKEVEVMLDANENPAEPNETLKDATKEYKKKVTLPNVDESKVMKSAEGTDDTKTLYGESIRRKYNDSIKGAEGKLK